jgi:hypothetical protein
MDESWETQVVRQEYLRLLDTLQRKCDVERREVAAGREPNHMSQILMALESVATVQQRLRDCQYDDRRRLADTAAPAAAPGGRDE